jgi:uncharacterized protein (DUF934 family)
MPNIIKDNVLVEDNYQLIAKDIELTSIDELPEGNLILPLEIYLTHREALADRPIAVWLDADQAPQVLTGNLEQPTFIAINFPAFADGRGYSYAYILRMEMQYEGEIRAIGDVLQDQLYYLNRSGFSSFAMREDQNLEQGIERLTDFSNNYQAAVLQQSPLFASR